MMNSIKIHATKYAVMCALMFSLMACSSTPRFPVATSVSKSDIGFVAKEKVFQPKIELGKSNRSDVEALLGKTRTIKFENNYELWVYQFALNSAAEAKQKERKESFLASLLPSTIVQGHTDFVVLFSPDGIARKMMSRVPESVVVANYPSSNLSVTPAEKK
jgi:hypothetical protein